jgi:hypothetical protein
MKTFAIFLLLLATPAFAQVYPIYGKYNTYQGYYRVNPYNGNINVYGSRNQYNLRLSPKPGKSGYNIYGGGNNQLYGQFNMSSADYQARKAQLRADYRARHKK